MQRFCVTIAALFVPSALFADGLPSEGSCEHRYVLGGGFTLTTHLSWQGKAARLRSFDREYVGEVVGLRDHDGGFKLSVRYVDDISGPSEMVVFSLDNEGTASYRIGIVTYDMLSDGTRVVSSITPFSDATCEIHD